MDGHNDCEQQVVQNAPRLPVSNRVAEVIAPLDGFHGSSFWCLLLLSRAFSAGFQLLRRTNRPSHARSIVGNPETALSIEQNDSPVAVEPLLEIVHRFRRDPLRQTAGLDAIRR